MRSLLLILLLIWPLSAQAERLALVIGNSDFERSEDLPQTAEDARAMAAKLSELGFELIGGGPQIDLTRAEMLRQIRALGSAAREGDEVVFYFSGHGIGGTQTNYLMPVNDNEIETKEDVPDLAVDVASVIDRLPKTGDGVNIFILDACRDSPLPSRAKSAYYPKGLVSVSRGSSNNVSLYAAEPGERAYVSETGRSFFTDAFLQAVDAPGQNLSDLMRQVRAQVFRDTADRFPPQLPWIEGIAATPFYFRPSNRAGNEAAAWARAQQDGSVPALLNFLSAFPDGTHSDEARTLITMKSGFVTRTVAAMEAERATETPRTEGATTDIYAAIREQALQNQIAPLSFEPGEVIRDCATCPELVVIPSGEFVMGSPEDEPGRDYDEGSQRRIQIDYQFAVGKTEVTWAEWEACVADKYCSNFGPERVGGDEGWGRGSRPVMRVNWHDAQVYLGWLSRKTGKRYRLLSEAEWEYVARAGTTSAYWWGSSANREFANYGSDVCCGGFYSGPDRWMHTSPSGSFPANPFGLYDLNGNVHEWTEDCFVNSYSGAPTDGSAHTVSDCQSRVLRGGDWSDGPAYIRSANRRSFGPDGRSSTVGFRVARTL